MSEDKKVDAKLEGVDAAGYMPPGMGPVAPYPPGFFPPSPCPDHPYPPDHHPCPPDHHEIMGSFACAMRRLINQQVTVYVMGLGPVAPVPVLPAGGGIATGSGPLGLTGMLHEVGENYIVLHVDMQTTRVVYIPFHAISAVVPGGPLLPQFEPNTVTTVPAPL